MKFIRCRTSEKLYRALSQSCFAVALFLEAAESGKPLEPEFLRLSSLRHREWLQLLEKEKANV